MGGVFSRFLSTPFEALASMVGLDGGAECPAHLSFEDVQLGVAEETELEGEVLSD
jgi:hypothetical protein